MPCITGLTQEDSQTIGFVVDCLFCQAIDRAELRKWCPHVVITNDLEHIPQYIFNLMDFDEGAADVFRVIGFVPTKIRGADESALYGIAYLRGIDVFDSPTSPSAASKALEARPVMLQRFREVFPFVDLGPTR
ncbi:hypothetical protein ACFXPS_26710 [Nocardia sp. NPDC059091]